MVDIVALTLKNVLPSMKMPKGDRLRIQFGLSRNSDSLIPYRTSIYFPETTGNYRHVATAALTDRGYYILGLEPQPIVSGGIRLGADNSAATPHAAGAKQDRYRPTAERGLPRWRATTAQWRGPSYQRSRDRLREALVRLKIRLSVDQPRGLNAPPPATGRTGQRDAGPLP